VGFGANKAELNKFGKEEAVKFSFEVSWLKKAK